MLARLILFCAVFALLAAPAPAAAEPLPRPVRAMIDAAIATGDDAKVATVLDVALATNPDAADEIGRIREGWQDRREKSAEEARLAREEKIRSAGPLDLWSGEGQLGAFHSSGNNDAAGLSAALNIQRKGIDWIHILRASADYQRSNGTTSREQYFAAYEPRIQVSERLFGYGLAQFEHNRFQGFDARYALSGGLGYRMFDSDALNLAVKAGPAYRVTDFVSGEQDSRFGALAAIDFDWRIADGLSLSQDASLVTESGSAMAIIIDGNTTTVNLVTGLDAKISDRLKSRLSYAVDYDSNPPAGSVSTDTMSRFSIVYDF